VKSVPHYTLPVFFGWRSVVETVQIACVAILVVPKPPSTSVNDSAISGNVVVITIFCCERIVRVIRQRVPCEQSQNKFTISHLYIQNRQLAKKYKL